MSGVIVEAGIYLLLLFTPLAFGGVEAWAIGVFQILAALVFVAWALGEGNPFRPPVHAGGNRSAFHRDPRVMVLWTCIGLFVLLVGFQLAPLPPSVIRAVAPATWELYASTLPGYASGEGFDTQELPAWLVEKHRGSLPAAAATLAAEGAPELPLSGAAQALEVPAWRTLSVYPYLTREKLTVLLCLVGIFAVVTSRFRTRERLGRLLAVSVGSVVLISLLGTIQKITWNGKLYWIREGDYAGVFGPFVNKNDYASYAVAVLPLAVCLALRALDRMKRAHRDALPLLVLNSFAAILIGAGIFYSLSRGGMVVSVMAIAIVGALLFYFGRHTREIMLLAGLFLVAGVFLAWIGPEEVIDRVGTITEGPKNPSLQMRFTAWGQSADLVLANSLVGTGFGTFRFAFMRYAPPGRNWWTQAHNEFIEVFTDTGVSGGLIALTGLGAFVLAVMRPGRFRGRSARFTFVGLVAGIAALLVHTVITSSLQLPAIGLLVVVLGGALLNYVRMYHVEPGAPAVDPLAGDSGHVRGHRSRRRIG